MKLPFSAPDPAGTERAAAAKAVRDLATEVSRTNPQAVTEDNGEEADYGKHFPTNFTKGLKHAEATGLLAHAEDYRAFVEAINSSDRNRFEGEVWSAVERHAFDAPGEDLFHCERDKGEGFEDAEWRGWESPRAGHVFDLEGPDAGAVAMAPAPRAGSSELAAEMAEVYALALLRDVPFSVIAKGGGEQAGTKEAELSAKQIVKHLSSMPFFSGDRRVSSTPQYAQDGMNGFERNRRYARTCSFEGGLTTDNVFRGSTRGARQGPYVSQFMLIGTPSPCSDDGVESGQIVYGTLSIDQRTCSHKRGVDYMTDWTTWLDVQNGADFKGANLFENKRRFITTPRDLATYVHFDQLYEAYLNAALIMLELGVPQSAGFPEPSPTKKRDAFATFGGPHVLSLVTEVATRCLKAVRRQKFNYHRRARPEALAGRLALVASYGQKKCPEILGSEAAEALHATLQEIPTELLSALKRHNKRQNSATIKRKVKCRREAAEPTNFARNNLLLPMAFPEGSPMHPAYGAGHATVAGGCVTMLKAFFEMFEDDRARSERLLTDRKGSPIAFEPVTSGTGLKGVPGCELTIQGELDKLAANIAIGRNMAGVHYYTDYYDSLRMGERVAVGILMEQAPTYGDAVETTFTSFDGDLIKIRGEAGAAPSLTIIDGSGKPVSHADWWLRHAVGQELVLDLQ